MGDSVLVKRVFSGFTQSFPNRVTSVELVELDMLDFDDILRMDRLHFYFASIDFRTQLLMFRFPNEAGVKWKGGHLAPSIQIISCHKACKIIAKVCLHHK